MRLFAFSQRPDELPYFEKFRKQYGVELGSCPKGPSLENVGLAAGYPCVSVVTTPIEPPLMDRLYEEGVRYISTRTIGYDHIDLEHAKKIGMGVGNVSYAPGSVADFTIMLILMAIRNAKAMLARAGVQDFSLPGLSGRCLSNLAVGVVGTGRIGQAVISRLSGFGCRILACDPFAKPEGNTTAIYTDLETLLSESDILTLHMPATPENYHMINRETLSRMKPNAIIVNTARGSLVDTAGLLDAIEEKRLGGAALDVMEEERGVYFKDLRQEILKNRNLAILKSYPNVIVTPHMAFYTDQSVSDMVEHSIQSCQLFLNGEENPWKVV